MADIESRVAVVERRLDDHAREIDLARERWHSAASDRATLGQLVREFGALTHSLEEVASTAAREAVAESLSHRAAATQGMWKSRAQWTSIGIAAAGTGLYLIELLRP